MKLENLLIRRMKKNTKIVFIAVVCIILVGLYVDYDATSTLSFTDEKSVIFNYDEQDELYQPNQITPLEQPAFTNNDEENGSPLRKEPLPTVFDEEVYEASEIRRQAVEKVCKRNDGEIVGLLQPVDPKSQIKMDMQRRSVLRHIIVNDEHKILYCYIPKVGCSNIKRIFLVMQGLFSRIEKVDGDSMRKATRLDDKKYSMQQREYMLKNYFKFLIVRDPFERLVSAYRNKWQNKANTYLHRTLGKQIVEKYRFNYNREVETGDDVTFLEYSRFLIDSEPWRVNEHWMTYERLCRPCEVNYDFIGSIETIDRDVSHVMKQVQANETKYYMIRMKGKPLVKSKSSTAAFLKELPRSYFEQLLAIFKRDHELFGFKVPEYNSLDERYPT